MSDGMGAGERDLLALLTQQIDQCSAYQHQLARRVLALRDAATMLRMGRRSSAVLAMIQERAPEAVTVLTVEPR